MLDCIIWDIDVIDTADQAERKNIERLLNGLVSMGKKNTVIVPSEKGISKDMLDHTHYDHLVQKVVFGNNLPVLYKKSSSELGVEPENCIVIAGSRKSAAASNEAGMICIEYERPDAHASGLSDAVLVVQGFEEVDGYYLENVYKRAKGLPLTVACTKRLILREMTVNDVEPLFDLYSDPSITRFIEGLAPTVEEEKELTKAYIRNVYDLCGYGYWVILERSSKKLIGRAGLTYTKVEGNGLLELGYMIGKPYQRQGYATEACSVIMEFARQKLHADSLHAFIHKENSISIKLIHKLGFQKIGEVNQDGKNLDHYCYRYNSVTTY